MDCNSKPINVSGYVSVDFELGVSKFSFMFGWLNFLALFLKTKRNKLSVNQNLKSKGTSTTYYRAELKIASL